MDFNWFYGSIFDLSDEHLINDFSHIISELSKYYRSSNCIEFRGREKVATYNCQVSQIGQEVIFISFLRNDRLFHPLI
jgi:hypothetical protein